MDTPTSLYALEVALRQILRPDLVSRPFVVHGSPFNCDVAIVGINPGSITPFWDYWSTNSGFARNQWVAAYYSRPGARKNATRNRIELLVPALCPLRVIELNAYPYATRSEADLTPDMRDSSVLNLMLRVASPKALFLFGRAPARTVGALLGIPTPAPRSVTPTELHGRPVLVFAEHHLSRGWSYQAVEAFAGTVKQTLANAA